MPYLHILLQNCLLIKEISDKIKLYKFSVCYSLFFKIEFVIMYGCHKFLMMSINVIFYDNIHEIAFNG